MIMLLFSSNVYIDKQLTLRNCYLLEMLFNQYKRYNDGELKDLIIDNEHNVYKKVDLDLLCECCKCSRSVLQRDISYLCKLGYLKFNSFRKIQYKQQTPTEYFVCIQFEKYKTALNIKEERVCKRIEWIDNFIQNEKVKILESCVDKGFEEFKRQYQHIFNS